MFVYMVEYLTRKRGIMNTFNKEIRNNDGTVDLIEISSRDNYKVNLKSNYKLANNYSKNNRFKNSIIGSDIGIHSAGFVSIAIISTLISISAFVIMILSFRI